MKGGEINLKQLIICVAVLSLILSGFAFAGEQKQEESTIVGPVLQNRYVFITPEDNQAKEKSEATQKLLEQGVFTAVDDARVNQQTQGVKK